MGCLHCSIGGTQQAVKKLRVNMRELVATRGFNNSGSCNCNGGTIFFTSKQHPGWRIDLGTNNFWIKQQIVGGNYRQVSSGNSNQFQEQFDKYFNG